MKIVLIIWSIISVTNLYAKNILLNAKITYTNNSSEKIKKIYHRVTIPSTRVYQKVKKIKVFGSNRYTIKTHKKEPTQRYVEFVFSMQPYSTKTINVSFDIQLSPYAYNLNATKKNIMPKYLRSSKRIESSSKEFQKIAEKIVEKYPKIEDQIIAAYQFPSKTLHYHVQKKTTALTALLTHKGDCTEYAMVFVAICRAMGIPARVVNLFNIKNKNKTWSKPNHNEAEIYIPKYGWMPIYSNLGAGSLSNQFRPGKISDTNIVYSHGVWTWSNYLPHTKHLKGQIKQKTVWSVQ